MRAPLRRAILLAAALSCWTAGAAAQGDAGGERILMFLSEVSIRTDGSLEVRETIRARAAGTEIRRGIYRDFPTRYEGPNKRGHTVPYDVVAVARDGRPEKWHTAGVDNGVRVYIGDKNVLVEPGEHTWELTYRTNRQLGYFELHDELYWNATGNGWVFPIDRAEARVTLPADPPGDPSLEAYTGAQGSRERDYRASWEAASRTAVFRTTRPLAPQEGLTIVVGWPKGIIAEPTRADRLRWRLHDQRGAAAGLFGLIVVLLYYAVSWHRVGRDPERGIIVVAYAPPQGVSPGAMRYLKRASFDAKAFAATVVQIAVKGHLSIEQQGRAYTFRRTAPGKIPLAPEEAKTVEKLFGKEQSLALEQVNHARIGAAVGLLRRHLRTSIDKVYLRLNRGYLATGVAISLLSVGLSIALDPSPMAASGGFLSIWLLGWSVGVAVLLVAVTRAWRDLFSGAGNPALAAIRALFLTAFSVPFVGAEILVFWLFAKEVSPLIAMLFPALAGVNFIFHLLLKAPTSSGRTLLDRIEGFERFLSATEADRINRMQGPQRTPELYEKFLPYAIALDLEKRWSEQFADVLSRAGSDGQGYSPAWYHGGRGLSGWSPAAFAGSVGSALSGAIASSSTAPGSRSGGGGGGSSGGGGGGGGGGGW